MTAMVKICWDSCVIIDLLQQSPGRIDVLSHIVSEARKDKVSIVVSSLAIAEVFKCDTSEESDRIDAFFLEPFVHVRNVDRLIASKAARIARNNGIKPPDAIHVATALDARCQELHTYDGSGPNRRRKHLLTHDGSIDGLRIVVPDYLDDELPLMAGLND